MPYKISDRLKGKNNFDFIRFFAAFFVILSHSFELTGGREPLAAFSHDIITIGRLCVAIFFIVSGMLITMSFVRSGSVTKYFLARALRIYPALIFVVIFSALILGPILTTHSLAQYFSNFQTYNYLHNMLAVRGMTYTLPGVFEGNHYPGTVNGSLWTLPMEISCYGLVAIIGLLLNKRFKYFVVGFMLFLFLFHNYVYFDYRFYTFGFFFLCGAMLFVLKDKIVLNGYVAIMCTVLLFATFHYNTNYFSFMFISGITLSYVLAWLAFTPRISFGNFSRYGDFSYGLYIWAFPVQQVLCQKFPHLTWQENFFAAGIITLVLAGLSYHLLEKKMLRLKDRFYPKKAPAREALSIV